jgi:hypothetical protein
MCWHTISGVFSTRSVISGARVIRQLWLVIQHAPLLANDPKSEGKMVKHLRKRLPGACLAATSAHTRPKLWRVLKHEYPSTLCHSSDGWCHCIWDLPCYWASAPAGEKERDIMNYFIYCIIHDIMQ